MIPTLDDVFARARQAIGDYAEDSLNHSAFSDVILRPHVATALRLLWSQASVYNVAYPKEQTFYLLPQYQDRWSPELSDVTRMGSVLEVREALIEANYSVSGFDQATNIVTLTASHAFELGDIACIYGVKGLRRGVINGRHRVTAIPGATQITLGGVVESGTYTSGGVCILPGSDFSSPWQQVDYQDDIDSYGQTEFSWERGQLRFLPSTSIDRLLSIRYQISSELPTYSETQIGFEGALEFLAFYSAGLACSALGAGDSADTLLTFALGKDREPDLQGGFLGDVLGIAVQDAQQVVHQQRRFRPRRNNRIVY